MRILSCLALAAAALGGRTQAQAPFVRSHVVATLSDSTFWPEGMDADPRTGRLYVASVRHRTIAEIGADGATRELLARDRADLGPIFGVRVDTVRGVLWATTSGFHQIPGADSASAGLLEIRISDGTIIRRWTVPRSSRGNVLGDLAVGPRGDVYISDSIEPVLYVLRAGTDTLETIRSPLFRSLQGLAPTPDGRLLFLADYANGLLRMTLSRGDVTRIAEAPGSESRGLDGIVWDRGAIIAVQNGTRTRRVMRYTLDATGAAIARADKLDENVAVADEPTIGAILRGEFVYVANSQWDKYDDAGARISTRKLTAPVLLGIPLP